MVEYTTYSLTTFAKLYCVLAASSTKGVMANDVIDLILVCVSANLFIVWDVITPDIWQGSTDCNAKAQMQDKIIRDKIQEHQCEGLYR